MKIVRPCHPYPVCAAVTCSREKSPLLTLAVGKGFLLLHRHDSSCRMCPRRADESQLLKGGVPTGDRGCRRDFLNRANLQKEG
jgi:hypothetical protein